MARSNGAAARRGLKESWCRRMYRTRCFEQFFELSSCARLQGIKGLMSLLRGQKVKPLDQPVLVMALAEFSERFSQLFERVEVPHR